MAENSNQQNNTGPSNPPATNGVGTIRLNNIQKIQLRKQQAREWPISKKLEKLAVYSSCKVGLNIVHDTFSNNTSHINYL